MGENCDILNVYISRLGTVNLFSNPDPPYDRGYILFDPVHRMSYDGSTPFCCQNHSNSVAESLQIYDLIGIPFTGYLNDTHAVVFNSLKSGITGYTYVYAFLRGDGTCTPTLQQVIELNTNVARTNYTGALTVRRQLFQQSSISSSGTISITKIIPEYGVVSLLSLGDVMSPSLQIIMPGNLFVMATDFAFDNVTNRFLVVGRIRSRWQAVSISPAGTVLTVYPTVLNVGICASPRVCTAALRVIVVENRAYVVVLTTNGIGVIQFLITDPGTANSAMLVSRLEITSASVTTHLVDTSESLVYLAISIDSDPSLVVKFFYVTPFNAVPVIRGTLNFKSIGFAVETVVGLSIVGTERQLWALTTSSEAVYIVQLALFAVESLYPSVADSFGGTTITVNGEGFVDSASCSFGGVGVPAQFISAQRLLCVAPPGGDEVCEGNYLEVSISGYYTTNLVRLKRSATPNPVSALNIHGDPHGSFLGGTTVTVRGFGFVGSSALTCRFTDLGGMNVSTSAAFSSTSMIWCPSPVSNRASNGTSGRLQVSIDNYIFSSAVPFTIVGAAHSLNVTNPPQSTVYKSADIVELIPSRLDVVDIEGHNLRYFDTETREITYKVLAYNDTQDTITDPGQTFMLLTLVNYTISGVTYFKGVALRRPLLGVGVLQYTHATWVTSLTIIIDEGEPYTLSIFQAPSVIIDNANPKLLQQPIIIVLDISGNTIRNLLNKNRRVETVSATYFDGSRMTNSTVIAGTSGTFEFSDIRMQGLFGQTYSIEFTSSGILPVTSSQMSVGNCPSSEYGEAGTTRCLSCPQNAVCNGSFTFAVNDGYWRASALSYYLYSCGEPYGESAACRGGTCTTGYTGPRCTQCEPGYGKSGTTCGVCLDASTNAFVLTLVCIAICIAVGFLIYTSFKATKKNPLPVLVKILLNHIQVNAQLGGIMTNVPTMLLSVSGYQKDASGSDPSILAAMDCLLHPNFYTQFMVVVALPWLFTAMAFIALNQLNKYQQRMRQIEAEEAEQRRDIGPFRTDEEYDKRLAEVGLTEEDDTVRLWGASRAQENRRLMLEKIHLELDQLNMARQSLLQLPHSRIRDDGLRTVDARQKMMRARQQGIEDTFQWVGRTQGEETTVFDSNQEESAGTSAEVSRRSPSASTRRGVPQALRGFSASFAANLTNSASNAGDASFLTDSANKEGSTSMIPAFQRSLTTTRAMMIGEDAEDEAGQDDVAMDAIPAQSTRDGYGTVHREYLWHPNTVAESYAQVEEQVRGEKTVTMTTLDDDGIAFPDGFLTTEDATEHDEYFDFEEAERNEHKVLRAAGMARQESFVADPSFVNPFEAPSAHRAHFHQSDVEGVANQFFPSMFGGVANPLGENPEAPLAQAPSALVILDQEEKDEGSKVTSREYRLMDEILFGNKQARQDALAKSSLGGQTIDVQDLRPGDEMDDHIAQLASDAKENMDLLLDPTETQMAIFGTNEEFHGKQAVFHIQSSSSSESSAEEDAQDEVQAEQQIALSRQLTLAAVVVFLLLYPTLINKCLLMVLCDDINYGPPSKAWAAGGVRSLLYSDRSIDCSTTDHQKYTIAALVTGLGYGIGIPLSITAYIVHLMRTRGQDFALTTFSYYTAGYDSKYWWWEGVILTRKLAIISISVFVVNEELRLYIAMWFLSIALMGHIQARPFQENMLHNMETLSLSTIVITLNLSLLFEFTETNALLQTLLVIVILLLNFGAILSILFFMGRELHSMFGDFFKQYGDTIKEVLYDAAMSLPLVPILVEKWRSRQAELAAEAAELEASTAVVTVGPDEGAESQSKETLFGRLINTLEGKKKKEDLHSHEPDAEAQAALILRGKSVSPQQSSAFAAVSESITEATQDDDTRVRTNRRRRASALAIDTDFREVLADRWIPPRDYEELWADIVDEDSNMLDLLCDEILHFHEVDQQQVYQLEDLYNRKNAELEKELRLRKAKRERRDHMMRKSQGALLTKGILKSGSRYGSGTTRESSVVSDGGGHAQLHESGNSPDPVPPRNTPQHKDTLEHSRSSRGMHNNHQTFRFTTFFEGM